MCGPCALTHVHTHKHTHTHFHIVHVYSGISFLTASRPVVVMWLYLNLCRKAGKTDRKKEREMRERKVSDYWDHGCLYG